LASKDLVELKKFIVQSICTEHERNVLEMLTPDNLIFKVISLFSQWK
jgi:hypothetical protein